MAQQPQRLVEVAVDVAGLPGGRLYTYHVPPRLADVVAGEAVLVDYGRRQALGIVLGDAAEPPPGVKTRPLLERVRSDGALLQPLGVMLARAMTEGYLAPAALAVRAMLPPGLLERLELMARLPRPVPAAKREAGVDMQAGGGLATTDPELRAALERIHAAGPAGLPVRSLRPPRDRAALLRRLRGLAAAGELELEWLLLPAGARPRLVRLARLSEAGLATARKLAGGGEAGGPRLGPRQRALLAELLDSAKGAPAARLAERHGGSAVSGLARRGLLELELLAEERRPLAGRTPVARPARPAGSALSAEQQHIVGRVRPGIAERRHERFLLEGAIASGKTAVYAELIAAALQAGRSALVLVPEIPLAAPLLDRLRAELGITPALVHSGLSEGERADEWRRIRAALAPVVIGTRIGVLAPLADPGLIVVDEEHDPAYKSDRTPRYQARDLALELGRLAGCPVVLGSATPDVVSVGRARAGELVPLRLAARLGGVDPSVEVVDLRAELEAGNRSLLSRSLEEALATLDTHAGERAILVLNRRGSASIVLCRDCGHVQSCPDCQRPLVFHAAGLSLRCHHCGASAPIARRCPACDSSRIRYLGGGTERLERVVRDRFPDLRVARLDRDVVERRGAAERVTDAFADGHLDVLVGTTLVTKGFDIPEVTLVGIVSADVALNLPDERAAERTYQLLAQAVGRAGRGDRPGRAIVQTYQPEHRVVRALATRHAAAFYDEELELRRAFGSPPYGRLVKLTCAMEDRAQAEATARSVAAELRDRAAASGRAEVVLGPAPAYIARRGGRWRFNLVLRGPDPLGLLGGDPGVPWSVDVDPESLL